VLNFVMMALYGCLMAQSWNLLGGYGGQFSFGHALFFGTGAYMQAIAQLQGGINPGWRCRWPWPAARWWACSSARSPSATASRVPTSRW
jgi:ABC-type branched-subunit amino acid transport system permease subunit